MSKRAADIQRRMWTAGHYPSMARLLMPISVDTVAAVAPRPGDRVLDVGTGTGNAAVEAARRGAVVTAIDLTPAQIGRARVQCAEAGADVDLRVADAQRLDMPDASFDAVLSVMGVIFAPDHARALAEMARVCRPGGTVAITAWKGGGLAGRWRAQVSHLVPLPQPIRSKPDEWGDPGEVDRRFAAAGLRATVTERPFGYRFDSVDAALDLFLRAAGPLALMIQTATEQGLDGEIHRELHAVLSQSNEATDGTFTISAPYLLAVATR